MSTQFFILCSHTHRTCVLRTFTHHNTTQSYQCCSTESKLLGTKQSHHDNISTALQLTINLQAYQRTQAILDKCLLSFSQTYLWWDTSKAHTWCRTCTCTTFSSWDNNQVGLSLYHTSSNSTNTTLCHQFHRNSCIRINILQIEDELFQILDRIDIVMRRRWNQRNTWYWVTGLSNNLVNLISWQLSTFTRLCTLSNLNLYLLGINKIFCSNTEATTCHLFGLTAQRYSVNGSVEAFFVLTTFTGIASCT